MKLIHFLKSKTFFANLLVAVLLLALLFWAFNSWLFSYTRHDKNIEVPSVYRLSTVEAEDILSSLELEFEVLDSSEYDPDFPKGAIIAQYPDSGSSVKPGRLILLTINPLQAKKIELPQLVEKSKRRAIYDLESKGFKVGEIEYVPDIGKDVVVNVKINGELVKAKTAYEKGTVVNLVLGAGLGNQKVRVPYLKRLTREEAEAKLLKFSLNRGAISYDEEITDTATALVFDQNPSASLLPFLYQGQQVDIWLTNDYTKLPLDTLEHLKFQTQDSLNNVASDSSAVVDTAK
tara:strand:+ start:1297 stop:2166 length:870 start_codon:yes stop_codon:yes gene_type:complete